MQLFVLEAAERSSGAASHTFVPFCELWSEAEAILPRKDKLQSQHFVWFEGKRTVAEIKFNMKRIEAINKLNVI